MNNTTLMYDTTLFGIRGDVRPADIDRSTFQVLERLRGAIGPRGIPNRLGRITSDYGSVCVSVETFKGEHHSTNRSKALQWVRKALGPDWDISAYLGPEYYRREDGFDVTAKRYSVVYVAR